MDNLYSKIRYKRFACEYRFLGKKIIVQYMLPAHDKRMKKTSFSENVFSYFIQFFSKNLWYN